jgi:cytochrome c-type biogenesis protein
MSPERISYMVAFAAGLLTFLSPCLLPLIPAFIAYITGISFQDIKHEEERKAFRRKTVLHSLLFIAGFSTVFVLLGLTATLVGKTLFQYQKFIRIAGGILIMLFGLQLIGVLNFDFLARERKLSLATKGASYAGSFLIGVTFAAAWTPCAGPILGSILVLAGTKSSVATGAGLLTAYSLGIAIPFFLSALLVNSFLAYFNRFKHVIGIVNIISGVFLLAVGMLVATNYLAVISEKALATLAK